MPVTVTPTAPLTTNWYGQNVRLTITSASSGGEVLAVPEAAVTAGADGRTRVTVVGGDGTQHQVEVKAGLSGEGYVAVEPVGGQLAPGDRVVTGT